MWPADAPHRPPPPTPGSKTDPFNARLPQISPTATQHLTLGTPWQHPFNATDHSGAATPVTLSTAPAGLAATGSQPLTLNWTPNTLGEHLVTVTATDNEGRVATHSLLLAVTDPAQQPVSPETIAPPLSVGATPFDESTAFLYTGSNPIQQGVADGTLQAEQAAVLRGLVKGPDNQPLAGVTVTILNHPEYGHTQTRADGWFDLAVNGGGILVATYYKPGYLKAQRKTDIPWRDYAIAEDVILLPTDPRSTPVTLNTPQWQAAIGTETNDERGKRTAAVLFPPHTEAELHFADGRTQALERFTFRATEYTVGDNGPERMPGELPDSVGYTYAVELSADEAIAAGAQSVQFNQPVYAYVDDFIGFPTGTVVPSGWYDYQRGSWIGSENGRVIRIHAIEENKAVLQVTEDNRPSTAAELAEINLSDAEREALAKMYPVGQALWRVPVRHFTPWDYNWPYSPPEDADFPPVPDTTDDSSDGSDDQCSPGENCCPNAGCDIYPERVLGQRIAIPGTHLSLNYRSDRAQKISKFSVPLTAEDRAPSPRLKRIEARIDLAGRRYTHTVHPGFTTGMVWKFEWDGKDAYDRLLYTRAQAQITVSQFYPIIYNAERRSIAAAFSSLGGRSGGGGGGGGAAIIGNRSSMEIGTTRTWEKEVPPIKTPLLTFSNAGGWILNNLRFYDAQHRSLYSDSGREVITQSSEAPFHPVVSLSTPIKAAISAPDGTLYALSDDGSQIIRITPDAPDVKETVIAGTGNKGFSGDEGPAINAQLSFPSALTLGMNNHLYFIDQNGSRIRHIDPDGTIRTVAGNGASGPKNQTGIATDTPLSASHLTADRDGNLFFSHDSSIYQISSTGRLSPVFTLSSGFITALASEPSGGLWIANSYQIHFIAPGGDLTTRAGGGSSLEDGSGPTLSISPRSLIPDHAKGVFFRDGKAGFWRHLSTGDHISSTTARNANNLFRMPDGELWRAKNHDIERMDTGFPRYGTLIVAHKNGRFVDIFNRQGQHTETHNTLSHAQTLRFSYARDYLTQITDADSNTINFERDSNGRLTAIIGVNGERSELSYNSHGMLEQITTPGGFAHHMQYDLRPSYTHLLTHYTDPNGHEDQFGYDNQRRLSYNRDAIGGGWTLTTEETPEALTNVMTSAEGRSYRYKQNRTKYDWQLQIQEVTGPDNLKTISTYYPSRNSYVHRVRPDGSQVYKSYIADPLYGNRASSPSQTIEFGDGLSLTTLTHRNHSPNQWSETSRKNDAAYITIYSNNLLTYMTPAGTAWTAYLDQQLRPVRHVPTGLAATDYQYNAKGQLTQKTTEGDAGDGTFQTRTLNIDYHTSGPGQGKISILTNALGQTISYNYDEAGRLTSTALPGGRTLRYQYDNNGNLTALTAPNNISHQFQYNAVNQATAYITPASTTSWDYNLDRALVGITRPGEQSIKVSYDKGGRLNKLITPEGERFLYYNTNGRLSRITGADADIEVGYTGTLATRTTWQGAINGSLTKTLSNKQRLLPSSQTIQSGGDTFTVNQVFDAASRLTSIHNLHLGYGEHGGLTSLIHGKYSNAWRYNDFGELSTADYTGPIANRTLEAMRTTFITRASALKSELLSQINQQGTCHRKGWVWLYEGIFPQWIAYEDTVSEEESINFTKEFGPPQLRTPDYCTEWVSQSTDHIIEIAQDSSDYEWANWIQRNLDELKTSISGGAAAITGHEGGSPMSDATSFMSTEAAELFVHLEEIRRSLVDNLPNLGFAARFKLQRDVLGRITSQNVVLLGVPREYHYRYDEAGRLAEYTHDGNTTTWLYDANGNRTHENNALIAEYDSEDRLLKYKDTTYTYAPSGNLASKTRAGNTTQYIYDSHGNLKQVTLPDSTKIEYLVDPHNRRIGKKKNGVLQYGLLYQDKLRPIAQLKPEGGLQSIFLYAEKANVPSAMIRDNKTYHIISDHLGSVRLVLDTSSGTIVQEIDYDAWGKVTQDTNPGFQPFGFAGGLYDPDTGLTRFGVRDYDAETIRWTAKDPILFRGKDTNLYGYVLQDPINMIDPQGFQPADLCAALWRLAEQHDDPWIRGDDLHIDDITHEQDLLRSLDLPFTVDGVDLQYVLVNHRFVRSSGWNSLPAALMSSSFFSVYIPVGSTVSALNNDVSFGDWASDMAADMRGTQMGLEAGRAKSFEDYVKYICPKECEE